MNGARTIHMWKGYLLTALAAGVLLAASPGVAAAQEEAVEFDLFHGKGGIDIDAPSSVVERGSGEITVSIRAAGEQSSETVTDGVSASNDDADDSDVTITLNVAGVLNSLARQATPAEGDDVDFDEARGSLGDVDYDDMTVMDEDPATGTIKIVFDVKADTPRKLYEAVFFLDAGADTDAEDENVKLALGMVTVTDPADNDADVADEVPTAVPDVNIVIDDDETQTYVMGLARTSDTPTEDDTFNVVIEADPPHVNGMGNLALQIVGEDGKRNLDYSVVPSDVTLGIIVVNGGTPSDDNEVPVEITAPENDGNRVTDTITLQAYAGVSEGSSALVDDLDIDVADIHALPSGDAVTAVARDKARRGSKVTEVEEGGDPVYLTVTVDRGSSRGRDATTEEKLTIDLTVADAAQASDYDLTPSRVTLPEVTTANGEQSTTAEIMLTARKNDDVGDETLTLNLTLSGEAKNGPETETGTFEITIVDVTEAVIEPKEQDEAYPAIMDAIDAGAGDEGLNPGESFTVMMDDLFTVMDDYDATYKASVSGDAVSIRTSDDSTTLIVEARSSGKAVVTVMGTAEAEMEASSFKSSQPSAYMADITFEVTVVDKALEALVVMLEMPANVMMGNIVEGESYDIMVSANRMIMEEEGSVEVMIMRDRAASDADDSDFTVSSATIMAGYDSATAELMVTEDMMPDGGTNDNMGESLVLYGMVDGEETNSLTFTIWDKAVPALPLFGQLLLALFLMLGGARLYRRRQA